MTDIYTDRDGDEIVVRVCRGISPTKERRFTDRAAAEAFANSKLGKRSGMIVSTLDMTPAQLSAHRDHVALVLIGRLARQQRRAARRHPDILNERPAERAEREDWEDRHQGDSGAHNDPGAPF